MRGRFHTGGFVKPGSIAPRLFDGGCVLPTAIVEEMRSRFSAAMDEARIPYLRPGSSITIVNTVRGVPRDHVERWIECLIDYLDALDGDPDLEPETDISADDEGEPDNGWNGAASLPCWGAA